MVIVAGGDGGAVLGEQHAPLCQFQHRGIEPHALPERRLPQDPQRHRGQGHHHTRLDLALRHQRPQRGVQGVAAGQHHGVRHIGQAAGEVLARLEGCEGWLVREQRSRFCRAGPREHSSEPLGIGQLRQVGAEGQAGLALRHVLRHHPLQHRAVLIKRGPRLHRVVPRRLHRGRNIIVQGIG